MEQKVNYKSRQEITKLIDLKREVRFARGAQSEFKRRKAQAIWANIIANTPKYLREEDIYKEAFSYSKQFNTILNKNRKNRIYIAGCGRSGTWLATGIMGTFKDIYACTEEKHFSYFLETIDEAAYNQIIKRVHFAHSFLNYIPKSVRILYVLRDPRDVLISNHLGQSYYISIDRWKKEMKALKTLLKNPHENYLIVKFEDLIFSPDETQEKIASFFNLEIELDPTKFFTNFSVNQVVNKAMHNLRPLDKKVVGRWRTCKGSAHYLEQYKSEIIEVFSGFPQSIHYNFNDWPEE